MAHETARPRRARRRPDHEPSRRRLGTRTTTRTRTPTAAPGEPPVIGIVGAGAVGTALGVALTPRRLADRRGGQPRRRPPRAVPAARPGRPRLRRGERRSVDEVELIILAVPDDVDRAARRRGSGCTAARRWSTPAACSAPRSWTPAMAAGTQVGAFHPLVAFADIGAGRRGAPRRDRSRSRATTSSPRCSADMAEAIGGDAGPPRARARSPAYHAAAVLAAGGVRRPARRDRRARAGGRPRRGGRAGDLRAAHRADPRQRPGARASRRR